MGPDLEADSLSCRLEDRAIFRFCMGILLTVGFLLTPTYRVLEPLGDLVAVTLCILALPAIGGFAGWFYHLWRSRRGEA